MSCFLHFKGGYSIPYILPYREPNAVGITIDEMIDVINGKEGIDWRHVVYMTIPEDVEEAIEEDDDIIEKLNIGYTEAIDKIIELLVRST